MTASSTLRAVLGLNFPAKNPVSKRLNHGSRRTVLFPNVISQPSVPNQVILTPAVPEPPLAGGVCAPSATPGSSNDLLQSTVAAATPAARPLPRNRRRETGGCHDVQPASTKHIDASSTKSGASLETARRRVKIRSSHGRRLVADRSPGQGLISRGGSPSLGPGDRVNDAQPPVQYGWIRA